MHVVRLQAPDANRYRQLMLQAYALAADAFTSTAAEREAEPESFWARRVADPSGMTAVFGAVEGSSLVGTVALEFSARSKTRHKAQLLGMYVSPEARGRGAGRALLEAAVGCARDREGTHQLTLTVTEGNTPALDLYTSAGFEPYGVEPMAILTPGGYKAKVHMWLALRRHADAGAPDNGAHDRSQTDP